MLFIFKFNMILTASLKSQKLVEKHSKDAKHYHTPIQMRNYFMNRLEKIFLLVPSSPAAA